jgi:hypothetical protein
MKKSFILSLVMVVVLIASLATATYAWYTAQTVVTTTATTISVAETGATLVIADTAVADATYAGNSVTLTMNQAIQPMVIDSAAALTTATTYSGTTFLTTTLNNLAQASGAGPGTPSTITTVTDGVGETGTAIYVANPGKAEATYYVRVTITDTSSNNGLRVAIFGGTAATADADLTLVGIWAPTGDKEVGYIDAIDAGTQYYAGSGLFDGEATMTDTIVFASGSQSTTVQSLAAYDNSTIANNKYLVKAWYEGDNVTNTYAGGSAQFAIEFNITAD